MEERKSMGGALVDVFDAGVSLVKSEINTVTRRVGDTAKAKGLGVVLLLAAAGPLVMALIFLILAVFYGLVRLGLGPWLAALLISLFSLAVTGGLVFVGMKRLSAEIPSDEPLLRRPQMTDDHTTPVNGTSTPDDRTPTELKSDLRRDPNEHAAGETRVVTERPGQATVRVEGGTTTIPVYESQPNGSPQNYGSGLNEQLADADHAHPRAQQVTQRAQPGIQVSTEPTYRTDMEKGNH